MNELGLDRRLACHAVQGAAILFLTLFIMPMAASADAVDDARAMITSSGRAKVGADQLDKLLAEGSPEVIVEFKISPVKSLITGAKASRARELTAVSDEVRGKRASLYARHKGRANVIHDYSHLPYAHMRVTNAESLAALVNDSEVVSVNPVITMRPALAESLPYIGQTASYDLTGLSGYGRSIAVLDTGVNFTDPAFGTCTAAAGGWQPQPSATCRIALSIDRGDDDRLADDDGHGTIVAAIAAAVAPKAKIIAVDVFRWNDGNHDGIRDGNEFSNSDADLIDAANWVVANQVTHNIVAMNMSLGTWRDIDGDGFDGDENANGIGDSGFTAANCPTTLNTVFNMVRAAGVVPVSVSGNQGLVNAGIDYPGCDPAVLSVGAVFDGDTGFDQFGNPLNVPVTQGYTVGICGDLRAQQLPDRIPCFSNSDLMVDIVAPGAEITAGGTTSSGTSLAAPHVAGVIAVVDEASGGTLSADALRLDALSTSQIATDPKWGTNTLPRLNMVEAIFASSVWTPIVAALPSVSLYSGDWAKLLAIFTVIGVAHRNYGTDTAPGHYSPTFLDDALRVPLIWAAVGTM